MKAICRFAIHSAVGVVLFVIIALIAVGLHKFVAWLEGIGAPDYVTVALTVVEVGLFAVDVALFVLFVIKDGDHPGAADGRRHALRGMVT